MTPQEFQKHIAKMTLELQKAVKNDIPLKVAKLAVRAFKKNFNKEGFFGEKWEEVKRRTTRTVNYKTKTGVKTKTVKVSKGTAGKRKILTGPTANLGRSIKSKRDGQKVTIYSDLSYSSAHNEGTTNAGKKHDIKIPKRQFIGEHPELTQKIEQTIEHIIIKIIS